MELSERYRQCLLLIFVCDGQSTKPILLPAPRLLLLAIALLMAVAAGLISLFTAAWPLGVIAAVVILLGATAGSGTACSWRKSYATSAQRKSASRYREV